MSAASVPLERVVLILSPSDANWNGTVAAEIREAKPNGAGTHFVPTHLETSDPAVVEWAARIRTRESFDAEVSLRNGRRVLERVIPRVPAATSRSQKPVLDLVGSSHAPEDLMSLATMLRDFAEERIWPKWLKTMDENPHPPGTAASTGMCCLTSACLTAVLSDIDPAGGWKAVGGHPSVLYADRMRGQFSAHHRGLDGGMWSRASEGWDGHYWVSGKHEGSEMLIDVTADQYGWDPVVVSAADDPRYRANYKSSTVAKDMGGRVMRLLAREAAEEWPVFRRNLDTSTHKLRP